MIGTVPKRGRRGFTLVELAMALGIMGVVLGAIWVAAGAVWTNYQASRVNDQVRAIVENMREYYAPIGKLIDLSGASVALNQDMTQIVDNKGFIPTEMRLTPGTPGNAINHAAANLSTGSVFIQAVNAQPGAGVNAIRIKLLGLSTATCTKLLMSQPGLTIEIGLARIAALGGTGGAESLDTSGNSLTPGGTWPISLTTATTWCNGAGKTNEVDLDFRLNN